MRVRLRLDGAHPRLFHRRLAERLLARPGLVLDIDASPGPGALPSKAATLFRLEALLGGLPGCGASAPIPARDIPRSGAPGAGRPDLLIDLCGDAPGDGAEAVWRVSYDGSTGEEALLASLLAGRSPVARIVSADGQEVAAGRLGTEARGVMLSSFEDGLVRTGSLILAALGGARPGLADLGRDGAVAPPGPAAASPALRPLASRAARMMVWALVRRLYHLCYRSPHWRVGWRHLQGPDVVDLRGHPPGGWRDLPDDATRFYADPFPIEEGGRTWLFVEDYEHRRGKAVISAVAFDETGPSGVPVPVLDEPHHLSYPFVFAEEGSVWMIPESGENGSLDLYRARAFPGGWVKEATLLSGIVASDATLLRHEGRWWMFATVKDMELGAPPSGGGSFSDALHLWHAPHFTGPWTPHPANPVLVDIASARPAGRVVLRDGALIRPVQDCRLGYGDALSLARITRLDPEGFAQEVETTLRAGPSWPGRRIHTLNRSGTLEFIDGSARAPRHPWLP